MELSQVVQHLQSQFPGQWVLYPKDLAQILGKTERSVEQLIGRATLPFAIKRVGSRRCASLVHVAQWLVDADELAVEVAAPVVGKGQTEQKRSAKSAKGSSRTSLGSLLMQSRHETASLLRNFATEKLTDQNERMFVLEVAERILFAPSPTEATFVITCSRLDFEGGATVHDQRKYYLDSYSEVRFHVQQIQNEWAGAESGKIVVRRNRRTIFNAVSLVGNVGWIVLKDEQRW